jgi:D-beta-D-heptose 7-phosphate kinase/D-beta-D-heptose 1-phosphate adenosyltransferase
MTKKKETVVAVSGYFNPIHSGHLDLLEAAAELGDTLVVIVNNDEQVTLKGSVPFMDEHERARIIQALRCVDKTVISKDTDATVCKTLAAIQPTIFANGGDRKSDADIPEAEVCNCLNITMVFNIGGEKHQSSSQLIEQARKHAGRN